MDCKKARDLLFGGYIDGELSPGLEKELTMHISVCDGCRKLEEKLLENAVNPFRQAKKADPPQAVWEGIKTKISDESSARQPAGVMPDIVGLLKNILYGPRPAFALATAAAIVIVFVVFLNIDASDKAEAYLDDQVAFMSSLSKGGERADRITDTHVMKFFRNYGL